MFCVIAVLLIVLLFPVFRFLWSVACWFVLASFIVLVLRYLVYVWFVLD